MRIVMIGDSITDMNRDRNLDLYPSSYGNAYPFFVQAKLGSERPGEYEIFNRGIGGNRVVDLYARIKKDCWNLNPDVVSILVGVNDVWHEIMEGNGVEIDRFEKVYRALIEDTKKALPDVKIMLLEPYVLRGTATEASYDRFLQVKEYAKVVERLAKETGAIFVPLQARFDAAAEKYSGDWYVYDGVHPSVVGSQLIADAWLEGFSQL